MCNGIRARHYLLRFGVWSPDSTRIAYRVLQNGAYNLFAKTTPGGSQEEPLAQSPLVKGPLDWSPDGRFLLYGEDSSATLTDLWILPLTGDRKPFPYLQSSFTESAGQFSPDGKWIAYASDETGRDEIYVRPFSLAASKWTVSGKGGNYPKWRHDGSELFYLSPEGELMSVAVRKTAGSLEFSTPRALFRMQGTAPRFSWPYDVAPDGKRFLVMSPAEKYVSSLTVLLRWNAERR